MTVALAAAAESGDASQEQLDVLNRAASEARDVTQEEYRQAYNIAVECVEDAGVAVHGTSTYADAAGGTTYSIRIGGFIQDEDKNVRLVGKCLDEHVSFIEMARVMRPQVGEAEDAIIARYLPALIDCVNARGAALSGDASFDDVAAADALIRERTGEDFGCVYETGLDEALDSAVR